MRKALIIIFTAAVSFIAGRMSVGERTVAGQGRVITMTLRDTIIIREPQIIERHITKRDTVRIAAITATGPDSCNAILEREQAVYCGEGYKAYVSGVWPRLDSLRIEHRTQTTMIDYPNAVKSRWQIGIQGGVGVTPRGVQPYIGVGISYRLL